MPRAQGRTRRPGRARSLDSLKSLNITPASERSPSPTAPKVRLALLLKTFFNCLQEEIEIIGYDRVSARPDGNLKTLAPNTLHDALDDEDSSSCNISALETNLLKPLLYQNRDILSQRLISLVVGRFNRRAQTDSQSRRKMYKGSWPRQSVFFPRTVRIVHTIPPLCVSSH